ncbi:MAG: DUF4160 domain-containing protein [Chitinophagaceae bacterium]
MSLICTHAKDFQYLQYLIGFYSNDHLPIHVHVQIQQRETKVEFRISAEEVTLIFKKVKGKIPLTEAEGNEVALFLKSHHKQIIKKWETVFIYHKKVECEVISKKLKKKL